MADLVARRRAEAPAAAADAGRDPPEPVRGGKEAEFEVAREGGWRVRGVKPDAGCGRPTSATPRPSATWPTGSTGSASRTGCSCSAPATGDGVAIGGADAVVFDFAPQLEAGAEILARRGEDQRLEERPARSGGG